MLGKLQQKKIERLFNILDANGNTVLEAADFSRIAERLAKVRNVDPASALYEQMLAMQLGWWDSIRQTADKSHDGKVTRDEWNNFWIGWLTSIADEAGSDQSPALDAIKGSATATFDMIDTNGDGQIIASEYADWCQVMSMSFDTQANFQRLDVSQTGRISRDETVQRLKEYFLTNDPEAPGNYLYGPLN